MSIVVSILIFGFIVLIHELGHFLFARKNDIIVEEFAIGMGPKLVGKKVGDTLYSIRIVPFGGFCRMLGEDEDVEVEGSFSSKSIWARIQVVIGGPLFNIILAFVFAILLISLSGTKTTTLSYVSENSPAYEAGLREGYEIIKVDGRRLISAKEIPIYVQQKKGAPLDITYKHGKIVQTVRVTPKYFEEYQTYLIGIDFKAINKANVFHVIKYSVIEILFWIKMVFYSLGMMIGGNVSLKQVSGPVGIVSAISEGYKQNIQEGLIAILSTISFYIVLLSANLGVMNLLPIPALDGGRLVFLIIEAIRRKPIDRDKEAVIHFAGYVLLMVLMVFIVYNDFRNI
jgi:regulator of sigma E protease